MSHQPIKVLLIEDNRADARFVQELLKQSWPGEFDLHWADRFSAGMECLEAEAIEVILLDLTLPDACGVDSVKRMCIKAADIPTIVMTGYDSEEMAREAMNAGAQDYLVKGEGDGRVIGRVMRHAIERKRLQNMKNEFVSSISHELRTPLTSIKNSVHNMLAGITGAITDKQEKYLNIIKRNVDRQSRVINDLLDIAKLESQQMKMHKVPTHLARLVDTVLSTFIATADNLQIDLKCEVGPDVPDLNLDPDRISQVLTNLIGNALKFTPEGGSITVTVDSKDDGTQFTVADTGRGIPEDRLKQIFDRFVQVERQDGDGPRGTGLGLAICQQLVSRHGGQIWAESKLNEGSRFIFVLPHEGCVGESSDTSEAA